MQLIFTDPPRLRQRRMSRTTSSGRCSAPTMSSIVRRGWAPERTSGRRDGLAALQGDAGDAPGAHVDGGDRGAGADDRADGAGAGGDRLGDRAHPAAHVAPHAAHAVELAQLVVEEVVGGPRAARAGPHADHPGGRVGALQRVVLEPLVEQVAHRHRQHAVELVEVAAAEAGGARGLPQELEEVAGPARPQRGRGPEHDGAQERGGALEQRLELAEDLGVARRDARQRGAHGGRVLVEEDRTPVGREGGEGGVQRDRVIAEVAQAQVGDHLGLEHGHHVGGARDALAGPQLLGDARAPHQLAALQDAHAQAGAREVGGGGEAVVAGAHHDGVVVRSVSVAAHRATSTAPASASEYRSATITSNACTSSSWLV